VEEGLSDFLFVPFTVLALLLSASEQSTLYLTAHCILCAYLLTLWHQVVSRGSRSLSKAIRMCSYTIVMLAMSYDNLHSSALRSSDICLCVGHLI
jgi:hypothetical protein